MAENTNESVYSKLEALERHSAELWQSDDLDAANVLGLVDELIRLLKEQAKHE